MTHAINLSFCRSQLWILSILHSATLAATKYSIEHDLWSNLFCCSLHYSVIVSQNTLLNTVTEAIYLSGEQLNWFTTYCVCKSVLAWPQVSFPIQTWLCLMAIHLLKQQVTDEQLTVLVDWSRYSLTVCNSCISAI